MQAHTSLNKPLVSIIVLTYNQERWIEFCISSILSQVVDFDYEIIIGNDSSKDATQSIVDSFVKDHPGVVRAFHHEKNKGMHDNFLFCIENARGNYIALCEGDDYWSSPKKLAIQVTEMESNSNIELVFSNYFRLFQATGELQRNVYKCNPNNYSGIGQMVRPLLLRQVGIATPTILFRRRTLLNSIKIHPEYFSNKWPILDFQIFIELAAIGKVSYLDDYLATYRVLPISASRQADIHDSFADHVKVISLFLKYARRFCLSEDDTHTIKSAGFDAVVDGALSSSFSSAKLILKTYLLEYPFSISKIRHHVAKWASSSPTSWFLFKTLVSIKAVALAEYHLLKKSLNVKPIK